jgi:OTU domain-containing protein 6
VARAEWGGQLELKALSNSLETCITVYEASSAPVLRMGEEYLDGSSALPPIRLSYHKHYFALGEHYNAVVPKVVA